MGNGLSYTLTPTAVAGLQPQVPPHRARLGFPIPPCGFQMSPKVEARTPAHRWRPQLGFAPAPPLEAAPSNPAAWALSAPGLPLRTAAGPGNAEPARPPARPAPARTPRPRPAPTPAGHLHSAAAVRSRSVAGAEPGSACGRPWVRPRPGPPGPAPAPPPPPDRVPAARGARVLGRAPRRGRKITSRWGRCQEKPRLRSLRLGGAPRTLRLTQTLPVPSPPPPSSQPRAALGAVPNRTPPTPIKTQKPNPTPDLSWPPCRSSKEPRASGLRLIARDCWASGRRAKGGAGAEAGAFKRRGRRGPDPDAGSAWTRRRRRRRRGTRTAPQCSGSSSSRDRPPQRWTETVTQVAAAAGSTRLTQEGRPGQAGEYCREGTSETKTPGPLTTSRPDPARHTFTQAKPLRQSQKSTALCLREAPRDGRQGGRPRK